MGAPVMPFLIFGERKDYEKVWSEKIYHEGDPGSDTDRAFLNSFYSKTIKNGVFFHQRHHWFSCLSHTEGDFGKTLGVFEKCMDIAKKNVL